MKKYPNMKDDISIGYIIHLLTDRYYNDIYYHTNIEGIEHQEFLDKLYKGCIDYIKDNINNYR